MQDHYAYYYIIILGIRNGTCTLLEKELGRILLWLPCRHHINEIILRSVFETHFSKTSGPNVAIFKQFQDMWETLDASTFKTGLMGEFVAAVLENDKDEISSYIANQLRVRIRLDYELIN